MTSSASQVGSRLPAHAKIPVNSDVTAAIIKSQMPIHGERVGFKLNVVFRNFHNYFSTFRAY